LDCDLKTFHELLLARLRELESFSLATNFLDVLDNWISNACRIYLRGLVADHLCKPLARHCPRRLPSFSAAYATLGIERDQRPGQRDWR